MTITQPRRAATSQQLRAVYTAMRILAEDDRERWPHDESFSCTACRRHRPLAGAVQYGAAHLCNGCATDYEVLRMGGVVEDVAGYLDREEPVLIAG
jgi:hypothetical protein